MYFVHSYAPDDRRNAIATCDYGADVVAAAAAGPTSGPPSSTPRSRARNGLRLLANFVEVCAVGCRSATRRPPVAAGWAGPAECRRRGFELYPAIDLRGGSLRPPLPGRLRPGDRLR